MTKFPFPLPNRYVPTGNRMEGGQGFVYVCEDTYLDRRVAIKVMRLKADAASLKKELKAMCELRSRHIAEVYDLVSAKGGSLGLVQEFVPGPSLEEYSKNTSIPLNEYLRILYQVSSGISDIHTHGKVHRDIKPENLKFDAEKVVKVLDLGFISEAIRDEETTKARGTDGFLGPEFFGPPPIRFSSASDVYAFGVTAWSLAKAGKLHASFLEVPPQSVTKMPSFSNLGLNLPAEVVTAFDAALNTDPKKRPTMSAIKDALERRLLYGLHRAVISLGAVRHQLSEPGKTILLRIGNTSVSITYDGLRFSVAEVNGDVYINNSSASAGTQLPHSCVITFGSRDLASSRQFIPIDTSHPEVVL